MRSAALAALILVVVSAGLGLRLVEAHEKSLWLDELHTLELAGEDTPGAVVDALREDFHAPLHFLFVHGLGDLDPHRMRLVSAAIGLLALIPLLLLARDAGVGGIGRVAIAAGVLLLPFQLRYGVELRPYAWLQLWSAICAWAAFSTRASTRTRLAWFALATAAGLYTHYVMAVAVVGIGVARLLVRGRGIAPLWKVVIAGAIGAAAFLPWAIEIESWIFEDPGVMTRNEKVDNQGNRVPNVTKPLSEMMPHLLSTPVRMAVPSVGRLGDVQGKVVMGGAGLVGLALLASIVLSCGRASSDALAASNRVMGGALLAAALSTGIMAFACWRLWNRVPIQYFALASWGWPLLLGALAHGAHRRKREAPVLLAMLAGLLLMGAGHSFGESRENLRAGVAKVREVVGNEPAIITAILRQPHWYSHRSVYAAYARDLTTVEPKDVPAPGGAERSRVVILTRSASPGDVGSPREAWRVAIKGRKQEEAIQIDRAVFVYVYR